MTDSAPFTNEEFQLLSDALGSHKAWLQRTLGKEGRFSPDLNARLQKLSELQAKVITMKKLSDTRSGDA